MAVSDVVRGRSRFVTAFRAGQAVHVALIGCAVLAASALLAGCGSGGSAVTDAATSDAATIAITPPPTPAALLAVVDRLLPFGQSGRQTCFSTDNALTTCPLTDRLRAQLQSALGTGPAAGGDDPICSCQNLDQNATFVVLPGTPPSGGMVNVSGFAGAYHLTYVLVDANGVLLADNIIGCSGESPKDAYGRPARC
jgi:hypothetical protein